jgi:predicted CXXCH cytochrome family protein
VNPARGQRTTVATETLRVRRVALAAVAGAAVAIGGVLLGSGSRLGAPGPLARPHVRAGVACDACHADARDGVPQRACVGCHGVHASTRPGHRALEAGGRLLCATCHPAHEAADGVTFVAGAGAVRWTADAERSSEARGPDQATVPLVRLSACTTCHDGARADDPLRACMVSGVPSAFSLCFDEHQLPGRPLAARGVCASQHSPARFVAWEAARAVALDHALEPAPPPRSTPWLWVGAGFATSALAFTAMGARARAGGRTPRRVTPTGVAPTVRLPVVDANRCLGCHGCVEACPFDVLSVDRHVAVVARPDECCGVGACEEVCPNGSLRLAEESEAPGPRPNVDAHLESIDRPGIFLAGDLTGVPLIRNAIAQGVRAADGIAETSRRGRSLATAVDVDLAVVGAGPAGLAGALRAKELGLSCVVLEQSTIAATVRAFPRGKIVHDPPIDLPLEGALWLREATKEELVAQWTRIVRTHRLEVREHHRVTSIAGTPGRFTVASRGPDGDRVVVAARVLLAIGRRGTPRRLQVPIAPAATGRVTYALSDARALAGKHVVIVGLGDSAMEAAVAVARQNGSTLTVCHRGAGFGRGRARNIDAVRRLAASGRIRLLLESVVDEVGDGWVLVRTSGGREKILAEALLVLIGGEPSGALLAEAGLRMMG